MTLPVAFRDSERDRDLARDLARGKACTMGATQKESVCGFLFFLVRREGWRSQGKAEAGGKKTMLGGRGRCA